MNWVTEWAREEISRVIRRSAYTVEVLSMPQTNNTVQCISENRQNIARWKMSPLSGWISSQTSWYLPVVCSSSFHVVRLLASWEWDSPSSPGSFFLAISQKSHWAENKQRVERWDMKRRTKLMHRSLKTASWCYVFQATSGSGRLFVSVLFSTFFYVWKADILYTVSVLSSSAILMAQLLRGHVYVSELVKWCSKSSSRGVVIYVYFPLIGISIGGGILCTHRAAARGSKTWQSPMRPSPISVFFYVPQLTFHTHTHTPMHTDAHTNTFTAYTFSQTTILIIPDLPQCLVSPFNELPN